eukprot:scaffold20000_cov112-Isochrysis_galbana.AAC.1
MEVDMNLEPGSKRVRPLPTPKELDAGAIARLRERLWHFLAWPCALAGTAGTSLGQWRRACRSWQGKSVLQRLFTLLSVAATPVNSSGPCLSSHKIVVSDSHVT